MYNFLKIYVGAFWTFQIALLLLAIAAVCIAIADYGDDGKLSDCVLVSGGIIAGIDAFIFAMMAAVMALGI